MPDATTIASGTPDTVLSDPVLCKRYRVIDTITPGQDDALYLAQRVDTGGLVELRVLSGRLGGDRVLVTALVQQATLVARVSGQCPGIATVHECERTSGGLVLAMEHPEGPTLREVIKREGTLDLKRALVLATRLGEVLEGVHNLGLVHGGLRPENVALVGPEERVVLKQFGFDWVLLSRSPGAGLHRESPREDRVYRAPEQAWEQATHRSDIYAFGAILYEMLAGTPAMVPSRLHVYQPLKNSRADVTPGFERIVMHALQVAPERRPADISAMCNALTEELASQGRPALSKTDPAHGSWPGKRMKVLGWGGVVALSVLAIWFANARITHDRSSPKPLPQPAPPAAAQPETPSGSAVTPSAPAVPPGAAERSAVARDSHTPRTSPRVIPPAVAPPKPVESNVPPPRSSPETRDDAANDPGAIIDWLLNEGGSKER